MTAPLAIAQSAANAYNATDTSSPTIRWASGTPTNGRYLIAAVRDNAGAPAPNTGWAVVASLHSASTGCYVAVYVNYTPASGAAEIFDTGSRDQWGVVGWEIENLAGSTDVDFIAAHLNAAVLVDGAFPFTTASFDTADANELILGACINEGPSPSTLAVSTLAQDAVFNSPTADFFGSFNAAVGGHETTTFSGTAVTATFSGGPGGSFAEYGVIELQSSADIPTGAGDFLTLIGVG